MYMLYQNVYMYISHVIQGRLLGQDETKSNAVNFYIVEKKSDSL